MNKRCDEKKRMIVGIINWVEDESCDGEERDNEKRMMRVDIINWVEDENWDGEEDDDDGSGDSATRSLT